MIWKVGRRRKGILSLFLLILIFLAHSFLFGNLESKYESNAVKPKPATTCTKFYFANVTKEPNCDMIITGDREEICSWSTYHEKSIADQSIIDSIRNNRSATFDQYPRSANSLEEEQFPIAFSVSVHKNVHQFERLLRLIYWPQNLYCIHVDARASEETKQAIKLLASGFNNVFMTKSEPVYWAGYGVLRAVLNCMNDTLIKFGRKHSWRYFINLSGMDFPLKTNLELVRIFKLLNGSNDVEFSYETQFSRYWFSYRSITDSSGHPYTHVPDMRKSKLAAPHGLKVYKGNLAAALSRQFVEYLFTDHIPLDFIDWLRDTDTADEHLWSTLNYNRIAKAPGSYPAECHNNESAAHISRYAVWRGEKRKLCSGRFVRDVCIFGVKDVHRLTNPVRKELFANKFYTDYQSAGFKCMEYWFTKKTREKVVQLNETFYATLPNVIYHNSGAARNSCSIGKPEVRRRGQGSNLRIYVNGRAVER